MIKLTEKDLNNMVLECVATINENAPYDNDYMHEMYTRVYNCINKLSDALLGPDYIVGDTMSGPQAAEAITNEIIRRYGRRSAKKEAQDKTLDEAVSKVLNKYFGNK